MSGINGMLIGMGAIGILITLILVIVVKKTNEKARIKAKFGVFGILLAICSVILIMGVIPGGVV